MTKPALARPADLTDRATLSLRVVDTCTWLHYDTAAADSPVQQTARTYR